MFGPPKAKTLSDESEPSSGEPKAPTWVIPFAGRPTYRVVHRFTPRVAM